MATFTDFLLAVEALQALLDTPDRDEAACLEQARRIGREAARAGITMDEIERVLEFVSYPPRTAAPPLTKEAIALAAGEGFVGSDRNG